MRVTQWTLTIPLLLTEAYFVASSALLHMSSLGRHDDLDDLDQRASGHYSGDRRRSPLPQTITDDNGLTLDAPDVERNISTLQACTGSLQIISTVTNEAGFAACYNILDWKENMGGMFQADLRLFQFSSPINNFADVPMDEITVQLNYPNSTQFSILTNVKRSVPPLQQRQTQMNLTQIQQYSLVGNFKMQLDLSKLNTTQLMSLLIPQISLTAPEPLNGMTISTTIGSSDTVYFVAGQFKDQATRQLAANAADPSTALAAIDASKGFVLPGTTFGIFPTGLIVTGAWCVLFLLAFGLGTMGRIRHRNVYRKRIAATSRRLGKR